MRLRCRSTSGRGRSSARVAVAFRPANSGRQVYESKGYWRRSLMDDRKLNVGVVPAVMTIRTREVGKAWATRSLGIALALCLSLTVGGDLSVPASAEPWAGVPDPPRGVAWGHPRIPGGIPKRPTTCAHPAPLRRAP